jgi:hypothetical protein
LARVLVLDLVGNDAEFVLRPNATDPDVLIRYRPGGGCSGGGRGVRRSVEAVVFERVGETVLRP